MQVLSLLDSTVHGFSVALPQEAILQEIDPSHQPIPVGGDAHHHLLDLATRFRLVFSGLQSSENGYTAASDKWAAADAGGRALQPSCRLDWKASEVSK